MASDDTHPTKVGLAAEPNAPRAERDALEGHPQGDGDGLSATPSTPARETEALEDRQR